MKHLKSSIFIIKVLRKKLINQKVSEMLIKHKITDETGQII